MNLDTRLSGVLHLLLHLAEQTEPMTSDVLARAMNTNPVVVRRTMAGLRDNGLVRSERGHGGGWRLARPLDTITLYDVHAALGSPALLALGNRNPSPTCLVEQAVNTALGRAFTDAEQLLLERLRGVTLGEVRDDFRRRMHAGGHHILEFHRHDA